MADDTIQPAAASDVLGGTMPPPQTGLMSTGASDATDPGGMLQPGNVSDNPDATAMLQPGGVSDNGPAAFAAQAAADPELHAAAVHHSRLATALMTAAHAVSDTLGGSATFKVTQDANGNPIIQKTDATEGEKWGRIAAGILGGAAKGFAAGQGPGGGAKAIGAGFDQGVKQAGQQKQQAEEDLDQAQKQMLFSANMAHLNQQTMALSWNNKHLDRDDLQKQQDYAVKHLKEMDDLGIQPIMTGVKDPKTLAQYGIANPTAVGAHMGQDGAMIYNEPDGKGGANIFQLSANQGNMRLNTPEVVELQRLDPKDGTKTTTTSITLPAGQTLKDRSAQRMAINVANDNAIKSASTAKIAQQTAATKQQEAQDKETREKALQPYMIAHTQAETSAANAEAAIRNQNLQILKGGTGAGAGEAAAGLRGDDYLKASGIDPAAWNRIKATANGDLKPPTTSRSPANAAFLNAVQNYDPTYTQARYDTKQNFKTKGDATSVMQLSTALAHAESALRNSATLGDSPSLATGVNLSGPAAAYNSDANFFTGEQGKLVMGGIVGEKEGERIRDQITSPIQSIRDSGLREVLRLTGGKVGAMFQKYKTGAQQDLPVQEFFDQPTQRLLSRYGVTKPQQPPPPPPPPPNVSQAARAPGGPAQATAPHAPAQRDNTGTITLPAGATGGYKNGKLVGYQDANGWHQ